MCCHLQMVENSEIGFIFSCPGRYEKRENKPAAGVTGKNLSALLAKLSSELPELSLTREMITITNAWDGIEYQALRGRTEASDEEILNPDNLRRVREETKHINKFIVCCGEKAKLAIENCGVLSSSRIIFISHLSSISLNKIKIDVNGNDILTAKKIKNNGDERSLSDIQIENQSKRLDVLCKKIIQQIED